MARISIAPEAEEPLKPEGQKRVSVSVDHLSLNAAIELVKQYGGAARPAFGIVGNVLAWRRDVKNAAQFRELEGAVARQDAEFERIRDLLETYGASIEDLHRRGILTPEDENRRAADPEFEQFVRHSVDAAVGSQSEAKRRSFGRYIAMRLLKEDEDDILVLRRAMTLTADLTERQLLAMAAIVMVKGLQAPPEPFADRAAAEAFARARYGRVIASFKERPWSYSDLTMLSAVGALSGGIRGDAAIWGESRESALDGWLRENGVYSTDGLADPEPGSNAAKTRYAAAFPTLTEMRRLEIGHLFDAKHMRIQELDTDRLDTLDATPVGWVMGEVVLKQLLGAFS